MKFHLVMASVEVVLISMMMTGKNIEVYFDIMDESGTITRLYSNPDFAKNKKLPNHN
jgi:hypothetical protein